MKTFEKISKQDLAHELQWHFDQDKIIQGLYTEGSGDDFKGCMMGCAVNSIRRVTGDVLGEESYRDHAAYIFGDESCSWFVKLYETIFEGLNATDAKKWVLDCFNAIPEGVEYTKINSLEIPIKVWILESTKNTHKDKEVHEITDRVIVALKSGDKEELEKAKNAAAPYAAAVYDPTAVPDSAVYAAADSAVYAAAAVEAAAAYATAAEAYAAVADSADYDNAAGAAEAADSADFTNPDSLHKDFYKNLSKFIISKLEEIKSVKHESSK